MKWILTEYDYNNGNPQFTYEQFPQAVKVGLATNKEGGLTQKVTYSERSVAVQTGPRPWS